MIWGTPVAIAFCRASWSWPARFWHAPLSWRLSLSLSSAGSEKLATIPRTRITTDISMRVNPRVWRGFRCMVSVSRAQGDVGPFSARRHVAAWPDRAAPEDTQEKDQCAICARRAEFHPTHREGCRECAEKRVRERARHAGCSAEHPWDAARGDENARDGRAACTTERRGDRLAVASEDAARTAEDRAFLAATA